MRVEGVVMSWNVKITGDKVDMERLCKGLGSGRLRVREEQGSYVLEPDTLNTLDDQGAVRREAETILARMSGALRLQGDLGRALTIVAVHQNREDSTRRSTVEITGKARLRDSVTLRVIRDGAVVDERIGGTEDLAEWLDLAERDGVVSDVLRRMRAEPTLVGLYNVYEIVEKDIAVNGGKVSDFVSSKAETRFTLTVNNPDSAGEQARHGVADRGAPQKPVALPNALEFIRRLVRRWLAAKVAGQLRRGD
jgi:hypothetical protein